MLNRRGMNCGLGVVLCGMMLFSGSGFADDVCSVSGPHGVPGSGYVATFAFFPSWEDFSKNVTKSQGVCFYPQNLSVQVFSRSNSYNCNWNNVQTLYAQASSAHSWVLPEGATDCNSLMGTITYTLIGNTISVDVAPPDAISSQNHFQYAVSFADIASIAGYQLGGQDYNYSSWKSDLDNLDNPGIRFLCVHHPSGQGKYCKK